MSNFIVSILLAGLAVLSAGCTTVINPGTLVIGFDARYHGRHGIPSGSIILDDELCAKGYSSSYSAWGTSGDNASTCEVTFYRPVLQEICQTTVQKSAYYQNYRGRVNDSSANQNSTAMPSCRPITAEERQKWAFRISPPKK